MSSNKRRNSHATEMQISPKSDQNTEVHPLQETNSNPVTRIYKIVRCTKSEITKLLHFKTYQNKKAFRIIRINLTAPAEHCMPWTEGSINHLKYISFYIPGMQACQPTQLI
jgi:hypothetical protein